MAERYNLLGFMHEEKIKHIELSELRELNVDSRTGSLVVGIKMAGGESYTLRGTNAKHFMFVWNDLKREAAMYRMEQMHEDQG